jgi:hypothetical protein
MNRVLWSNDCLKPTDAWPAISKVNNIYLNMKQKKLAKISYIEGGRVAAVTF